MKDCVGKKLEIGDEVAYGVKGSTSVTMSVGQIIEVENKRIRILKGKAFCGRSCYHNGYPKRHVWLSVSEHIVKINDNNYC